MAPSPATPAPSARRAAARSPGKRTRRNLVPAAGVVSPIPYAGRSGDREGLALLGLGGVAALGATALALHHPALREAARLDAANAAFVGFAWLALALIGNALWILLAERPAFAPRWWIASAVLVAILVGVGIWTARPLPSAVTGLGAFLMAAAGVVNLCEPFVLLATMVADARRYPNAESFRLVRRPP